MKKQLLFLLIVILAASCSSIKNTQEAINTGNYNKAINLAVENLIENKTKFKEWFN